MNKEICLLGFIDKEKREKIGYYLFFAGIMLELLVMVTDNAANFTIPYRGRITHVAFMLFCTKILCTKYKVKEWLVLVLLTYVACVSYFTCDDEYVIRVVAIIFAAKGVELNTIFKKILFSVIITTLIISFLSLFNISGELFETRHFGRGEIETRYMFGFNHANNVHDILWMLFSLSIIIKKEKMSNVEVIMFVIANLVLYYFTRSRTGFLVIILLAFFVLFIKNIQTGATRWLILIASMITLMCSVFLTIHSSIYNIDNSLIMNKLDPLLNGRLQMATEHAHISDWKLFPESRNSEYVDNGFSTVFYCYGIVIGVILLILLLGLMYKLFVNHYDYLAAILISAIMVLFMESTFMINTSLICNMLILIAIESIWSDTRNVNNCGGKENGIQEPGIS